MPCVNKRSYVLKQTCSFKANTKQIWSTITTVNRKGQDSVGWTHPSNGKNKNFRQKMKFIYLIYLFFIYSCQSADTILRTINI